MAGDAPTDRSRMDLRIAWLRSARWLLVVVSEMSRPMSSGLDGFDEVSARIQPVPV